MKGATVFMGDSCATFRVSIHAPMKGATVCLCIPKGHQDVSIHAPMKGATSGGIGLECLLKFRFNPRSHEGSDKKSSHLNPIAQKFQSTLP